MKMKCDTCGNNYAEPFQVIMGGRTYTFDSFECAIQKLAPLCEHCGCRVIGHGEEKDGKIFCCSHCLRNSTGSH
jgi:Rieske Fe-S protein